MLDSTRQVHFIYPYGISNFNHYCSHVTQIQENKIDICSLFVACVFNIGTRLDIFPTHLLNCSESAKEKLEKHQTMLWYSLQIVKNSTRDFTDSWL